MFNNNQKQKGSERHVRSNIKRLKESGMMDPIYIELQSEKEELGK
jgi:hypothetical protein